MEGLQLPYDEYSAFIRAEQHKLQQQVIKHVLRQYLGREPELEDAARTRRLFSDEVYDRYLLQYRDTVLGMVYLEPTAVRFDPEVLTFKGTQ